MYSFLCPVLYYILNPVGFLMPCVCPLCAYILRHVKQSGSRKESKKLDFAKKPLSIYMLLLAAAIHKVYNDVHRPSYVLKRPEPQIQRERWNDSGEELISDVFFLFSRQENAYMLLRLDYTGLLPSISRRRISKSEENQKSDMAFCSGGECFRHVFPRLMGLLLRRNP